MALYVCRTIPRNVDDHAAVARGAQRLKKNARVYSTIFGLGCLVAFVTFGLGVLATQSTEFMDFENGLNALPSNVLQVNSEVLPNCQDYPACKHQPAFDFVYTSYFRKWFIQPTDRFELWVTLLMANPVVDVVESVVLLTHVPEWTSLTQHNNAAPPTAANSNSTSTSGLHPVCGPCVCVLAIGLLVRAVLVVVSIIFFVACFDWTMEAYLPDEMKWEMVHMQKRLWWLVVQQTVCAMLWQLVMSVYQGNLLWSYCTASVAAGWYGVALFFSFVPGVAVMPISEWLLQQSSCNVLDAANAQLFLLGPLVAGIILSCIVVVAMVCFVVRSMHSVTPTSPV